MGIRKGTPGDDVLWGGIADTAADLLLGRAGDDGLYGLGGDDTLRGGSGDDLLDGDATPPFVRLAFPIGEPGNDLLEGGRGRDTLVGGAGADTLDGGSGADLLEGGAGGDLLLGGRGDDSIDGGFGFDSDDVIQGGQGADSVRGGGGLDLFLFATGDFSADATRPDLIADFTTAALPTFLPDHDLIRIDTADDAGALVALASKDGTTLYRVEDGEGSVLGYLAVTTIAGLALVEGADYAFV